ncbi:unnamed protein product [Macrosiphum euphorbiae]|nr:unnamed protein product [Macrosiphum euphorbiae]
MGCGSDEEIDHLKEVTINVEGALTGLTLASVIPGFGAFTTIASFTFSSHSAVFLMSATDMLLESLDSNGPQYDECRRFIEELKIQTKVLRGLGLGATVATMIPLLGTPFIPLKIGLGVSATTMIVSLLNRWKEKECSAITGLCTFPRAKF